MKNLQKELKKSILYNKKNLKKIEKIVHPKIQKNMRKFIELNKREKILIFDIPLLMENKIFKKNFVYVFVDSKKKDIFKRLKKRKNYNKKLLDRFRNIQLSLDYKRKKSDFIIKNNFTKKTVKKDINNVLKKIL